MSSEIISKLVGLLQFDVDMSGLQRFERGLAQARQKMMALSREADVLQKKLGAKLGVKIDSAARDKLDKSVRANLDRELKLETAVQRTRRATFTAELQGQKLINLRQKEGAAIQSQALRDKISAAIVDAKSAKAETERLKVQGLAAKQAHTLKQHKARQARWEALLGQQQQKTAILQQKQYQAMTATQRAELALQQVKVRNQRAAEKFTASQEAAKIRAQRLDVSHAQRAEKFQWAQTRQAHWEAKRNESKPSTGFMGLGTGALALGGVTAGVAAVVAALEAISDRLDKRQADATESQTYSNIFAQVGGKNPANAARAEKAFAEMTEKYGMTNTTETAADFRVFMLSQRAKGIAMSKSLATYETQLAAFRAAGMTRTQQERAVIQLQQVRSVGKADTEDVRTFSEAAPLIKQAIVEAWGQRTKYKGDNLDGAFMKSIPKGGVLPADFEAGFARFVSQQQDTLARQMVSIDAQQTRLDNAKYLQAQQLNSSPELLAAIADRLKAETELTAAMKPFKETLLQFDIGLTRVATSMLRLTAGNNADGTVKTSKQIAEDVGKAGYPEGVVLDPSVMGDGPKPSTGEKVKDPISVLYRWLTNTPDYEDGPAKDAMSYGAISVAGLQWPKLDLSKLGIDPENMADGQYRQFRMSPAITASDIMQQAAQQQRLKDPVQAPWVGPGDIGNATINRPANNVDSSVHNDVKVQLNIDARGLTPAEVTKLSAESVRDELGKVLQETRGGQKEIE